MKALILAAGLGTRLAPLTDTLPKALVPVRGTPIIVKQIENIKAIGITDITVVVGYRAERMRQELARLYPEVRIIENSKYAETNNMFSAYLAKDAVAGSDFLMMNGDVFFDDSVLPALIRFPSLDAVAVEIGRYREESMKVRQTGERLTGISKQISPDQALGCSIDLYKLSPISGEKFFTKCAEYIEQKKKQNLWSETALHDIFADCIFKACPICGRWFEIDTLEDLAAAERLFE